jgi:hypothetical protein
MAGQTKGGRKPAGFPLFGRSSVPEDEEEGRGAAAANLGRSGEQEDGQSRG